MRLFSNKHIVDKKIREALTGYGVKPSGRVWWRITNALDNEKRNSPSRKALLIIGFVIFMGSSFAIFKFSENEKSISTQNQISLANRSNTNATVKSSPSINQSSINEKTLIAATNDLFQLQEKNQNSVFSDKENYSVIQAEQHLNIGLNEADMLRPNYSPLLNNNIKGEEIVEGKSKGSNQFEFNKVEKLKGYLGASLLFNSTWLIDQHAMSSEFFKYKFTAGLEFGMEGGYVISKHFGIAAGWYLNSFQGQKYKNIDQYERTTSLEYNDKSISFTYMNLPVFAQYRISKYSLLLNTPVNVNLILGGQYGKMISYRNDDIKGELSNNELFYKNDLALVAGVDYSLLVNRPVFYTIGLRASYGSNVFNGEVPNDYEFDKPHNFLLGIHCAMNFSLDKNGFVKW
jgi:hypothetical protein